MVLPCYIGRAEVSYLDLPKLALLGKYFSFIHLKLVTHLGLLLTLEDEFGNERSDRRECRRKPGSKTKTFL